MAAMAPRPDERRELLTNSLGPDEDAGLIPRNKRARYTALARALCRLFCCPPIPSRIVAKLSFAPPNPPGYTFDGGRGAMQMVLAANANGGLTAPFNPAASQVTLLHINAAGSNEQIACLYLRRERARFTILLSHGNAEDLGYMANYMAHMSAKLSCSIFSYDYPGYGLSAGSTTESKLYKSIDAAWNCLHQQFGVSPRQIVLYGVSIGSAPSVWLAAKLAKKYKSDEHKLMPAGLILHSPLASGLRVFKPDLSLTWCCDPFKNVERVAQIVTPTLIVHGTSDEIVPVSHGYALHAKCDAAVDPLFIESGGHNDLDSFPVFYSRLQSFLNDLEKRRRKETIDRAAGRIAGGAGSGS